MSHEIQAGTTVPDETATKPLSASGGILLPVVSCSTMDKHVIQSLQQMDGVKPPCTKQRQDKENSVALLFVFLNMPILYFCIPENSTDMQEKYKAS